MSTLDRNAWLEKLETIAEKLGSAGPPVRLCLVGSAACLLEAMPGRSSRDLDVWQPASDFDRVELKRAVVAAGLLFDPQDLLEPDQPYVKVLSPGPSQTGDFTGRLWGRMGRLEIYLPPWENLIASKLVRGDPKDVEDVLFLVGKHSVDIASVRRCVESLPRSAREQALKHGVSGHLPAMTAREEELTAREMLEKPHLLGQRLTERRWADVAALVRYAKKDVPPSLAMTDPALYRTLREGVTRFYMRGGGSLSLEKLEALATQDQATD